MTKKWDDPEVWNDPHVRHIYSPEASDTAPRWWERICNWWRDIWRK